MPVCPINNCTADYLCHLSSGCKEGVIQQPTQLSVEEILSKSPDTPLTQQEMKLTTNLVRRRLSEDPRGSGILQVKTGGQVQHTT